MPLALTYSRAHLGIHAPLVTVETHLTSGLPALTLVGLPETAVRESKDRVRSALINSGFEFPQGRVTINLAPADLPKEGGRFDLAIAIGLLIASGQLPQQPALEYEFLAELALAGQLRPCPGCLGASLAAKQAQRRLVVAPANGAEAALAGADCAALDSLNQLVQILSGLQPAPASPLGPATFEPAPAEQDLSQVLGQEQAKRALLVAAAGHHNLLLCGPPGTGKTMLAQRLRGLLPPLNQGAAMEAAVIASSLGAFDAADWRRPPWRAPHHSASAVALVGGGRIPRAGEVSRAHQGVLFLDELGEFPRSVLDALRQPLESGEVHLARAHGQVRLPARFLLVAATNPCPCGYYGEPRCRCSGAQIGRYLQRLSGPLLDRIDLQVGVQRPPPEGLLRPGKGRESAALAAQVAAARERQLARGGCLNGRLTGPQLSRYCALKASQRQLLQDAATRLQLSPRGLHKVLRVARTLADLEGQTKLTNSHLLEALSYRHLHQLVDAISP